MPDLIPHSKPCLGRGELAAVSAIIRSGHLSQGRAVGSLEKEFSKASGHRHAIAVSSGSAGLFLALKSLDVKPGNDVIIPTFACSALYNAVSLAGARPVFADVDPESGNVTAATARKALTRKTKAAIAVHLWGNPIRADEIERTCGVPVIEDCAQALGAEVGRKPVGRQTSLSLFSLYTTKVIAAGEGGIVCTSNTACAHFLRDWREYDNPRSLRPAFNFKLTDIQAAIASAQLTRLQWMMGRRREIARAYRVAFKSLPVQYPALIEGASPAHFRFVLFGKVDPDSAIRQAGLCGVVLARPIFRPLHQYHGQRGFPGADAIFRSAVSIPIYPALRGSEFRRIINAVREIYG